MDMKVSSTSSPAKVALPRFSPAYKNVVLSLLAGAYALSTIDRNVIGVINQAIKVDLKLTDTQLGLLGGISFALLYTFLGIPIARIAERRNRVSIIAMALFLWSGFTVLCGFAGSFLQLAAFRVGVGFGEAGLNPSAHSLISDYFEQRKRSTALSIYALGIPVGALLGAALGGWLAKTFGWRIAFAVVGAPGILMALLMKVIVKEPPRGHSDRSPGAFGQDGVPTILPPASLATELGEVRAVIRALFLNWPILNVVLGMTIVSFSYAGASQFSAPYFIREFGLDYATVGLIVGFAGGVSGGVGTFLGGFFADRAGKHNAIWYALLPALGILLGTVFYLCAYSAATWRTATMLLILPGMFYFSFLGPSFGLIHSAVDSRRRATAVAVVMFFTSLIGQGLGPPFTGWVIDHSANWSINHPESLGLRANTGQSTDAHGLRKLSFTLTCPGGSASIQASSATAAACAAILKHATRRGVIVSYLFSFWGGAHFLLACFGLKKHLKICAGHGR